MISNNPNIMFLLSIFSRPHYELEQEAILEGHLATEVVMVVVDALELLVGVSTF